MEDPMSRQQREALDALLRSAPYNPDTSVADQRAGFAERQTEPLPDDVTTRETSVAERPTLELEITGGTNAGMLLCLHGGGTWSGHRAPTPG
jgi:epsilon-lactone hydrolase